jgi:type IV pilus assembly protein PilW
MRARQLGLSMAEIMVAAAIGMIGILIITQAYLTSDRFNRATLGEGGAQTNGLIALFTIERDVRVSGYGIANSGALGCSQIYWYYDPNYSSNIQPGSPLPTITLAPVLITTDTVAPVDVDPVKITAMFSTDAERILPTSITNFNAKSSEVTVDGTAGYADGDLVLMVGSSGCTLGKITQVQPGPQKLQLNPGVSAPYNPPAWGSFPTTYASGDSILNLGNPVVREYSIVNNKLQVTDALLQAGGASAQVLVDGIVDMRAQYGHDSNGDGTVDTWNSTTPTTSANWQRVLAVRIAVLARIGEYEKPTVSGGDCDATTSAPTWTGSSISGGAFAKLSFAAGSTDRCYRYRVFETTVPLRNMIWRST